MGLCKIHGISAKGTAWNYQALCPDHPHCGAGVIVIRLVMVVSGLCELTTTLLILPS